MVWIYAREVRHAWGLWRWGEFGGLLGGGLGLVGGMSVGIAGGTLFYRKNVVPLRGENGTQEADDDEKRWMCCVD